MTNRGVSSSTGQISANSRKNIYALPVHLPRQVSAEAGFRIYLQDFQGFRLKVGPTCLGASPEVFWATLGSFLGGSWAAAGSPASPLGSLGAPWRAQEGL